MLTTPRSSTLIGTAIAVFGLLASPVPSAADPSAIAVDTGGDVGQYTSMALDIHGNPVVSYSDGSLGGLSVLHCNDPDCSGGDESIESPDRTGGLFTSLVLDAAGNPVISHFDNTDADLRLVHCNDPDCSGGDESITTPVRSDGNRVREHNSLALDSNGNPVISYWDSTNDVLKVVHCNDPDCAGDDESIAIADVGGDHDVGSYSSLVLDADGNPVISHRDLTNEDLRLVHCNDPNCAGGDESVTIPDPVIEQGDRNGRETSLVLDGDGYPVISHQNFTAGGLRLVRCNDPDCAGDDESTSTLDPNPGAGRYSSVALDALGNPVISYWGGLSPGRKDLRLLHCDDPTCSAGGEFATVPDSASDAGRFTSLVIDAAGNPVISHYDFDDADLRVVHCDDPRCLDDESVEAVIGDEVVNGGRDTSLALDADGYPVISHTDINNGVLYLARCNDSDCEGADESMEAPHLNANGHFSSLALDAADIPVISEFIPGNEALWVTRCDDPRCAEDESPQIPDGDEKVGRYTSMELDGAGNPVISYQDDARNTLRVLHCNTADCSGTDRTISTPDITGGDVGAYTSLTLDAAGNPVVSYFDDTNAGLRLLHCNDPSCLGQDESVELVDATGQGELGHDTSLVLDQDGHPVISHWDATNDDLRVVHCNDPNCAGGDESITTPDTTGEVGAVTSLALDDRGNPIISYFDRTDHDLRIMHCNDPDCAGGDESITAPDTQGRVGRYTSLVLDQRGNPVVSYRDDTNGVLKVLRCNDPSCAPQVLPSADAGGPYTVAAGGTVTLAGSGVDPDGGAVVLQWDLDDDGVFDDATGPAPVLDTSTLQSSALQTGTHTIALRVVDDEVNTATARTTVTVGGPGGGPGGGGAGGGPEPNPDGVIETAIDIARTRYPTPAQIRPEHVVLARTLVFADALTGSVLTQDAPLLFTDATALDERTATEIDRLLGATGTVILLGGENALAAAIEQALADTGHTVVRLDGPSRVETAVAIADHAQVLYGPAPAVGSARADAPADNPTAAWADSVAAGGWAAETHSPILLTPTGSLHPATDTWLTDHPDPNRIILGGALAVSEATAGQIGPHTRIGGSNRFATAVAIADQLRPPNPTGYLVTSGEHPDGWAYALAAAGLSAGTAQPLLLVGNSALPPETDAATCTATARAPVTIIGDDTVVPISVRTLLTDACSTP